MEMTILVMNEWDLEPGMKLSLHLDVYLEDTRVIMEAHPKRDDCFLDEDTSVKTKFTVSTTGISRVMLENIKKRLMQLVERTLKP